MPAQPQQTFQAGCNRHDVTASVAEPAGSNQASSWPHLIKGELPLEQDEQPAVGEEEVEALMALQVGVQGRVQQLHQLLQRQQLRVHAPAATVWGSASSPSDVAVRATV